MRSLEYVYETCEVEQSWVFLSVEVALRAFGWTSIIWVEVDLPCWGWGLECVDWNGPDFLGDVI